MKRLLLPTSLLLCTILASCAPLIAKVQGEAGSITRDGTSIYLNNPGPGPMTEAVMRLEGLGLVLGAPCVARTTSGVWGCVLKDIPEGEKFKLTPTSGTVTKASANFYRGDGALFHRLELP